MTLSRRRFLTGAAAASGALLILRSNDAFGLTTTSGASRRSPLKGFKGTTLALSDLHNHSILSDGDGDPAGAYAAMRRAGMDVAALTDHASIAAGVPSCGDCHTIEYDGNRPTALIGINDASWTQSGELADASNKDFEYTAVRGFEWSSPTLGHVNVWFSKHYTDPTHTLGAEEDFGMKLFYEWLDRHPETPVLAGGNDGIAGFNHPGREAGRYGQFTYDPAIADHIVSIEVFNRGEDYLFEGVDQGLESPILQCLNAGWRVGLIGVSDHHGTNWGAETHKGRAGLWVQSLTRAGVKEAMRARRFFATTDCGLRLSAVANGAPMGSTAPIEAGKDRVKITLDLAGAAPGRQLNVQVLGAGGGGLPEVVHTADVSATQPIELVVPRNAKPWLLLRVTDRAQGADGRASGTPYAGFAKRLPTPARGSSPTPPRRRSTSPSATSSAPPSPPSELTRSLPHDHHPSFVPARLRPPRKW